MSYGILIPNAAVAQDDKGEFAWVLYEKEKPLGNEFYVRRAYINIDDSDNSKTAVLSGISMDDSIVVGYNRNLSEETRVIQD